LRTFRTFFIVFLLASLAAAQSRNRPPSQPKVSPQLQQDMDEINKLHDKDIQASIALDEPAFESLWTDDIVTMHPGAPPIVGKEANVEKLQAGIKAMSNQEIMAYNEQFQEVRIQGDWAYEWGAITGRTRPFSGGQESSYKFNVMRILQRQPDGTWKIARSIYNDAEPPAAPKKEDVKPKPDDKNKLED
jgi:ketosteroid isomerase-like protein